MKNLYTKSKGKIHPSPSCQGIAAGDALAVLNLLPAAILVLTAALGAGDREVLAYLVTRSLQGPWCVVSEDRRRCRRQSHHQPLFDCGCFDCYTSYWCRWDSSPDREVIHQAIEAFEEHLASSERQRAVGKVGKAGRRRDRRGGERADKAKGEAIDKGKGNRKTERLDLGGGDATVSSVGGGADADEEGQNGDGCCSFVEEAEESAMAREEPSGEVCSAEGVEAPASPPPQGGERRRGWPDVVGLFSSRLWGLWSPEA